MCKLLNAEALRADRRACAATNSLRRDLASVNCGLVTVVFCGPETELLSLQANKELKRVRSGSLRL